MPLLCTTKIQKERAMSIFGVYALICTFLLLVYYMVTIWFDLHGSKGSRKEETETISTGDMVDTETSTAVRELDGGGYQLSSTEFEEEPLEEPALAEPSGESETETEGTSSEEAPDSIKEDGNDSDSSDGPSDYERAKKVHDEDCNQVNRLYEMQLQGNAMLDNLTRPVTQKNLIHRHKIYL
jgi:hypothetical protein